MQYFKNVELAKLYPVSESAVRKWIDATRNGKLDLQLYEHGGKTHIANTAKNIRIIEDLVERGQKYKNSRSHKTISPKPEFYELYNKRQILDIISNIDIYHEIPRQYGYFDGGATYWDSHANRLWEEDGQNTLKATIALLNSNTGNIDGHIEGYDRVNVIDLGVGNCIPVKEFLTHLLYNRGILGRYIAIDLSSTMLDIAEKNITQWFGDKIAFERYERDFSYERFDDILAEENLSEKADKILNLVLLFGDTLANLRSPNDVLRTVCSGMGRNDLLFHATKLDSPEARRYFDFSAEPGISKLPRNHRLLPELLNIDESYYDVEQGYDEDKHMRFVRLRLKVDLTMKFEFDSGTRKVSLHKGDGLLILRIWHQNMMQVFKQFEDSGFAFLHASATRNRRYLLTVSEIDTTSDTEA